MKRVMENGRERERDGEKVGEVTGGVEYKILHVRLGVKIAEGRKVGERLRDKWRRREIAPPSRGLQSDEIQAKIENMVQVRCCQNLVRL